MRRAAVRSVLVFAALTVMLQARVESTRWWWSPAIISALGLSDAQSRQLDSLYESTLPTRSHLAEQIVALADRVQQLNEGDAGDDELMPATERLTRAQAERCQLRVSLAAGIDRILSAEQRDVFHRLLARRLITTD